MEQKVKFLLSVFILIFGIVLSACAESNETVPEDNTVTESDSEENKDINDAESDTAEEGMDHSEMNHSSSGEVPEDLAVADNPTYPVGSQALMHAKHMPGMEGATATITGAFETTVYSVTYTPTDGGEPVENHKWVIHEEIEDSGEDLVEPGEEAVLNADHMQGMDGAAAAIDSAEQTTVYMVNFKDTETGEEVENHKWVTEAELSLQEK
ncbi:YdhK family protein [Oceanobacillus sp. FSL H7-0719]|uniref:YdhK family protein n=1 Tax=Oceanobacillus sp. FSL H7-0719 TaxID=2954507 RepID=UPI0032455CAC